MSKVLEIMPELEGDEAAYINKMLESMDEEDARTFAQAYRARRREPTNVLLITVIGFLMIAGIQRFYLQQIGMGLLYLFTGGLCLVGTIVDLINYKSLAFEYNREVAREIQTVI